MPEMELSVKATVDEDVPSGSAVVIYVDLHTGNYRARLRRDGDELYRFVACTARRDLSENEVVDFFYKVGVR